MKMTSHKLIQASSLPSLAYNCMVALALVFNIIAALFFFASIYSWKAFGFIAIFSVWGESKRANYHR